MNHLARVFHRNSEDHTGSIIMSLECCYGGSAALYDLHRLGVVQKWVERFRCEKGEVNSAGGWGTSTAFACISPRVSSLMEPEWERATKVLMDIQNTSQPWHLHLTIIAKKKERRVFQGFSSHFICNSFQRFSVIFSVGKTLWCVSGRITYKGCVFLMFFNLWHTISCSNYSKYLYFFSDLHTVKIFQFYSQTF